jgi:hypothetical protein
MDLCKLNYDFNKIQGFQSAYEKRRSFAVEHFDELLSYAMSLEGDIENANKPPKRTVADNYPAGGLSYEPCDKCLDLLSVLEDIANLPDDAKLAEAVEMAGKHI